MMRYLLWVAALLRASDVIQDGRHIGRHLGFYRKLESAKKHEHVEYDLIKHFAVFLLT